MTVSLSHLPRLPDWQLRLQALVQARLMAPFAWGAHDCCLFAADAVQALLGQDPAAALRGQYHTADEAERIVHSFGGLEALATAVLGPPVRVSRARPGDIVLMAAKSGMDGPALGVCNGSTALGPAARGLVTLPTVSGACAWGVGRA